MNTVTGRAMLVSIVLLLSLLFIPLHTMAAGETELTPGLVNPGYHEKPDWFKVSFLDLYEDVEEAAENDKRVMVYFFQDGCPYCKKLLEDNFGQRDIAEKTQQYFEVVPINIWGDREVTVGDKTMTEKDFSAALKVQYTPTLMFFNENNKVVFRANGYYPPEKFNAVLDYVGQHKEEELAFNDYYSSVSPVAASGKLHTDIATVKSSKDLSAALSKDKYLLVMFEQHQCVTCDELHLDILKRPESRDMLKRFNIAVIDMWSEDKITTPDGSQQRIRDWSKKIDVKYAPSLVFFNAKGEEVFRSDAYLKAFHIQSVMDYVASGAYQEQPNFQRFVDARADALRAQGIEVDLMK